MPWRQGCTDLSPSHPSTLVLTIFWQSTINTILCTHCPEWALKLKQNYVPVVEMHVTGNKSTDLQIAICSDRGKDEQLLIIWICPADIKSTQMACKRGCIDLFTGWQFKIRTGIFQSVYLLCQKLFIVIPDYRSTTAKTTLTITFFNAVYVEGPVKTYAPLLSEHREWLYSFYFFALFAEN